MLCTVLSRVTGAVSGFCQHAQMDIAERDARTAWSLICVPGDASVGHWIQAYGAASSLAGLRSSRTASDLARWLRETLDGDVLVTPQMVAAWRAKDSPERVEQVLMFHKKLLVSTFGPHCPQWPSRLNDLGPYAPVALYVRGNHDILLAPVEWLGVVGSRRSTLWGQQATRDIVLAQHEHGRGIVSGAALGIDTAAHQAALESGAPSIAVLAGGLDSVYPVENRSMIIRLAVRGAVVSEAPATIASEAGRFLHRNRLIAALSDALIVVEAAHRSGALNTAAHAASLGRELGIVPGRWSDSSSAGCLRLVREKSAQVLTDPGDVNLLFPGFVTA